jgi:hypothetical protein
MKQLAYDALALSLTGPIDLLGANQSSRSILGEGAVSRNLNRSPILDNLQGQASMTAYEPTTKERLAAGAQTGLEFFGMRRPQARSVSQGIFGGPSSPLPAELGVADVVPFLGTAMQTQEAARSLGRAGQLTEQGEYGQAAMETGMGILGMVPGAAGTVQMARPILRDLSSTPPIGAVRIDQAVPPKADVVSPIEQARQISKQPQFRDAFTTSDPYVYHLSDNKNIESFVSKGIKASKKGMSGPGVYLARTPEETQYYSTLDTGTLYRIDKEKLIKDYGLYHYKDNPSGKIQFDETTGEILVDAKNIPSDYIEVKIGTSYTPLQELKPESLAQRKKMAKEE